VPEAPVQSSCARGLSIRARFFFNRRSRSRINDRANLSSRRSEALPANAKSHHLFMNSCVGELIRGLAARGIVLTMLLYSANGISAICSILTKNITTRLVRTYGCTRTRRSRAPSRLSVTRWRCQFWADCTTNISGRKFPTGTRTRTSLQADRHGKHRFALMGVAGPGGFEPPTRPL
jgi:hypothetical protein